MDLSMESNWRLGMYGSAGSLADWALAFCAGTRSRRKLSEEKATVPNTIAINGELPRFMDDILYPLRFATDGVRSHPSVGRAILQELNGRCELRRKGRIKVVCRADRRSLLAWRLWKEDRRLSAGS